MYVTFFLMCAICKFSNMCTLKCTQHKSSSLMYLSICNLCKCKTLQVRNIIRYISICRGGARMIQCKQMQNNSVCYTQDAWSLFNRLLYVTRFSKKGSNTRTVSKHTFHCHLLATSVDQQHMRLILLKVEQSAFTEASFSSLSDIHECLGDL